MLMRKLVPHFVPSCGFIIILEKFSYYASIMLNAFDFRDLLCSKLCWHNRPGPMDNDNYMYDNLFMKWVGFLEVNHF